MPEEPLDRSSIALRRIDHEDLPLILTDPEDIEAVSSLVQDGHLKAVMQVVFDPRGGGPQVGVVVRGMTPSAWVELRNFQWRRSKTEADCQAAHEGGKPIHTHED